MNPYKIHADSLSALQAEQGDDCPYVEWAGDRWSILPGSAMMRKDLEGGGFQMNADFAFTALVSTFLSDDITDAMSLKNKMLQTPMKYLGEGFKVASVMILAGGLQVRVEANSLNQRA